ncbi:hypothetical protein L1987_03847 [Smallanthus sonchifolius]|uniref:Uncharacterized protein n=1 Tax=Smallanthus sonchifolius TaxID=185202 RepID=A0ACB9KBX5_9ASTR|nr:hypothetical protein L1987_03847 [Smallanthus sonchifolius]
MFLSGSTFTNCSNRKDRSVSGSEAGNRSQIEMAELICWYHRNKHLHCRPRRTISPSTTTNFNLATRQRKPTFVAVEINGHSGLGSRAVLIAQPPSIRLSEAHSDGGNLCSRLLQVRVQILPGGCSDFYPQAKCPDDAPANSIAA